MGKRGKKAWKKAGAYSLAAAMAVSCLPGMPLKAADSNMIGVSKTADNLAQTDETKADEELVQGLLKAAPAWANLTKQGDIDWVHMDSDQFGNFNRKNVTEPGITDMTLIGQQDYVTGNSQSEFVYSDGMSPMMSEENNRKALVFTGQGNGFSFHVPASTQQRYLDIYTGAWAADIKVTVSVNGEETYSNVFGSEDTTSGSPAKYQVLELDYHTESEDDEVVVTVMVDQVYDAVYGNMNIGGITLGTKRVVDDGSLVGGEMKAAPASSNLTSDGKLDWFYLNNANLQDYNRKAVDEHLISDVTLIGRSQSDPISEKAKTAFIYSDGMTPKEESGGHRAFVFQGEGSGIEFTLPGSTDMKYVSLYAGAWASDVKVEVLVNDKVQYTTSFGSSNTTPDTTNYQVARLQYQTAKEDDVVKVRAVVTKVYDAQWGNMNVSAVTVSDEAPVNLDETIKTDNWEINFSGGEIQSLKTKISGEMYNIPVRTDKYSGFAWTLNGTKVGLPFVEEQDDGSLVYTGNYKQNGQDLTFTMHYTVNEKEQLVVTASIKNNKDEDVDIEQASIQLGFNTYLERYPDYNDQLFPTLIRCEKTHAWGYFSTPSGRLMTISTDNPVASYTLDYESGAHRIYSASLDVLQSGKLPERHPQDLDHLKAKEEKTWNIYLQPVEEINDTKSVKPVIAENSQLPMFDADRYTLAQEEESQITILSESPIVDDELKVEDPDGNTSALSVKEESEGVYKAVFEAGDKTEGVYKVMAENEAGYLSEMTLSIRKDWSWYIKKARQAAVEAPQKGSSHAETYYGFYSGYVAKKYFPDDELDEQIDAKFEEVYPLMYDVNTGIPTSWQDRIQNHSTTLGISVDQYESSGNMEDLERAEGLADYLMTKQGEDGGYYSGSTDYTSVIYPAKSIMELTYVEKDLMNDESLSEEDRAYYKERYELHMDSLTKAMDKLVRVDGNFDTEGQGTFEDGANSCSITQLSEFALMFPEGSEQREKYTKAAEEYMKRHTSHQQSVIPDSRMNGGTLRFWEAQYDVEMGITSDAPNMMNSPHGWSAWSIYGLFNLYELTGNTDYLERGMNAMGSCAQLMGYDGILNWAFIADPQRHTKFFVKDEEASEGEKIVGKHVDKVIGEEYVPMISYWWKAPKNTYVTGYTAMGGGQGSCCDNDVHEVFKAMGEVALTKAYVVEKEDGSFEAYNAKVTMDGETVNITPEEDVVSNVSVQLLSDKKVAVNFYDGVKEETVKAGKPVWVSTKENAVDTSKLDKDSSLKNLQVTGGELDKEFDKDTYEYAVDIGNQAGEVTIIPTVNSDKAIVYVDGNKVESGTGYTVKLDSALMEKDIKVIVKSQMQSSSTTYTVKVSSMGSCETMSTEGQVATAGSQHASSGTEGPASNVLDGNTSTIWHTNYSGGIIPMEDRWIDIQLKEQENVCGVRYLPRQSGDNGKIKKYEIHVSNDNGKTYTKVAEGEWDTSASWKTAAFDEVQATNVRIVPITTSGDYASAAEIRIIAAGEEPQEPTEISTAVLEYALSLTDGVSTDGVVASVAERYQAALDNAKDILSRVQSHDASVTQEMVDGAWKELISAMQYLSFRQGDKTDLGKVIALADEMNGNLDSYLDAGKDAFTKALTAAKAVYEDGDAMQEEVDSSWKTLMDAMAGLFLKPDKSALETLLNKAESFNEADYEAAGFAAFRTAFMDAKAVYEDEQATTKEVKAAQEGLENAIANLTSVKDEQKDLVADANGTSNGTGDEGKDSDNKGKSTDNSLGQAKGTAAKSAKTGDDTNGAAAAAALAAAVAALAAWKKRK